MGATQEVKAKKLEMAKLQIALQQAENRKNQLLRAAAERSHKQRELEDFEAMKLRVLQLERMVAAASAAPSNPPEVLPTSKKTSGFNPVTRINPTECDRKGIITKTGQPRSPDAACRSHPARVPSASFKSCFG